MKVRLGSRGTTNGCIDINVYAVCTRQTILLDIVTQEYFHPHGGSARRKLKFIDALTAVLFTSSPSSLHFLL